MRARPEVGVDDGDGEVRVESGGDAGGPGWRAAELCVLAERRQQRRTRLRLRLLGLVARAAAATLLVLLLLLLLLALLRRVPPRAPALPASRSASQSIFMTIMITNVNLYSA